MKTLMLAVVCLIVGALSCEDAQAFQPGKNVAGFQSYGEKIAAFLYLPADYVAGKKRPAIVVTPPASGVKEQTAGIYAEKLSKKGYVTLAFDPRGWGESEGHKSYFSPYKMADDTKNAISFMSTLDEVDTNNIFNLGICMGAGIAGFETAYDSRVKALAVVSPYLVGPTTFIDGFGGAGNMRKKVLPGVARASQKYFETGEDTMRKMVPETEEEMKTATPVGIGMREYYLPGKPGGVPTWRNEQSFVSGSDLLSFLVFNYLPALEPVPTYVVYGTKAVTAGGAIKFYEDHKGPKEKLVIDGAGHFDLYWMPKYVNPAVDGIAAFLNQYVQ